MFASFAPFSVLCSSHASPMLKTSEQATLLVHKVRITPSLAITFALLVGGGISGFIDLLLLLSAMTFLSAVEAATLEPIARSPVLLSATRRGNAFRCGQSL